MKVAVVIPAFKVSKQIVEVVRAVPKGVSLIIVVDDCCPEGSGEVVREQVTDARLVV